MSKKPLEVSGYILPDGAAPVRFEELTAGQRDEYIKKAAENITGNLSRYLSENPDEARKLLEESE